MQCTAGCVWSWRTVGAPGTRAPHHHLHRARREVFRLLPRRALCRPIRLQQAEMLSLSQGQPIRHGAADGDRLAPIERQPLCHFL